MSEAKPEASERACEHTEGAEQKCKTEAPFRVTRGRQHDAQRSCRRHLAATVTAIGGVERAPVTVEILV